MIKQVLLNLLILLDELVNTVTLGSPEETVSSRAAKARNEGKRWGCVLCALLNRIQKDHCDKAIEPPSAGDDAILKD